MLNKKFATDMLNAHEVTAISSHLITNTPQIRDLFKNLDLTTQEGISAVENLVISGTVINLEKSSTGSQPVQEDLLYRRGKMSESCSLILNGKITVLAGKDEVMR